MVLPSDLVSQFVKATNDSKQSKEETTVYGTTVEYDGRIYVKLDGSELLTPVSTTAKTNPDERVTVLIKNHTATITGNVSSPAARGGDVDNLSDDVTKVEVLVAKRATIDELNVERARIDSLEADNVIIKDTLITSGADIGDLTATYATITEKLTAAEADIDDLQAKKLDVDVATAKYATIKNLDVTNADVHNLEVSYGNFRVLTTDRLSAAEADIDVLEADKLDADTANITYAKITDLDATNSEITNLEAEVADIDTLIFGSASGDTIHISFANAVIAQLGNAQIKSAMIESISADKITAGDIITNNVRVKSEDGKLLISDETIQISDDTRVRVQIGKDASNDYSINIWDSDGNLMFSQGGITDSAIKDAIIRNDMVSDTANIAAHKLDIDSLFEEINGSSKTIKSTKIYLDDEEQTLDVAFETLTTDVNELGETVSSQGTQISTIQGQITSKVWQQDIDTASNEMSTQYSTLEQEVDDISATVASHTTQISNKADSSTVTTVSDKVTKLETNLSGFQSTVSNTYATKTEVESIEIGGRNLFSGYGEDEIRIYDYKGVGSFRQFTNCLTFNPCETVGETYTISFWAKSPNGTTTLELYNRNQDPRHFYFLPIMLTTTLGAEWEYFTATVTNIDRGEAYSDACCNRIEIYAQNQLGVLVKKIKVEKGTKATDWTPAPEDVQANIDIAQAAADAAQAAADQNAVQMAAIVSNFNADVENLQTQIDGSITTWFFEVTPTESNEPAVNWATTDLKNNHLGDLYYDTITGYCYRWQVQNNIYSWQRITDTDVTKALSDAQAAQDTADQKRRVFYTQPTTPYDAGDLWVQGSGGDILRCKTAKISGQSYASSDWIVASKYTDDTTANTANNNAIAAQNAASKAQSDINNLTIGGRNLILNSATILLTGSDDGNNNVSVIEDDYVAITAIADGNVYNNGGVKTSVPRKKGVEYTLSFEILTPTYIGFCWYPSEHYSKSGCIPASDSWQKYVFTYTQTGDDATKGTLFGFIGLVAEEKYCYRNLKLEIGNRATDWTPAPEDLESEVAVLDERVTSAESRISQNEKSIALTVTKTEVSTTYATKNELTNSQTEAGKTYATKTELSDYATKTELSTAQTELTSEIELKEDSILSTVSSTYATKTALSEAKTSMNSTIEQTESSILSSVSSTYATKSALATTNSNIIAAQNDIDNLEIGGRNLFSGYDESEIQLNDYQSTGSFTQFIGNLTFDPSETVGETYTISFWAKSPNGSTPLSIYNQNGQPRYFYFDRKVMTSALGAEWEYFTYTLTNVDMGETYTGTYNNRLEFYASAQMGVLVKKIKVEKGNRATDWTPAPEDMATGEDVTSVHASVEATDERVTVAESLIQQLSDSIMMLVTDGNGESLMIQTETGWTFSTAQIQSMVDNTAENLDTLTNEMGDVNTTVDALQQAVSDLGVLNDYVKIGTYENEPCIELGETDSDFKLMITNTRIMFMEGSGVPAYINNQSLFIKKAVVEEELQQGEFVWKARSNGNLGLIWKGVTS